MMKTALPYIFIFVLGGLSLATVATSQNAQSDHHPCKQAMSLDE